MKKWLLWIGVPAVLLIFAGLAAVWVAQSDWLRERVRRGAIEQAELATGGRVEIGAFRFDWPTMTAEFDRFAIHGTEPAGEAPLLTIDKVVAGLRVFSVLSRDVRIRSIVAERPAAHVIVQADGRTNIPQPKVRHSSKPLEETILDLRIANFDLRNGTVQVDREGERPRVLPWNARGENLTAHATFDAARRRYAGEIALAPVRLDWEGHAVNATVNARASMERNRIAIAAAHLEGEGAIVDLSDGVWGDALTAKYRAHFANKEMKGDSEGSLRFTTFSDYEAEGTVRGEVRGIRGTGTVRATQGLITIRDGHAKAYGGDVEGGGELRNYETFHATGRVRNVALRYGATASGAFEASGDLKRVTSGQFRGQIGGAARGEVDVRYTPAKIEFGETWVELPHTRVDLTGTLGDRLHVRLQSTDLNELAPALDYLPAGKANGGKASQIAFDGTVSGALQDPQIVGRASAKDLSYAGYEFDSVAGDVTASRSGVTVHAGNVVYSGIAVRGDGSVELQDWAVTEQSKITGNLQTTNTDLLRVLTLAGHKEVPIRGAMTAAAQISGTVRDPLADGGVTLRRGTIYEQPFDTITAQIHSAGRMAQTMTGLFVSGPKRVNLTARFEHAGTRFPAGTLGFNLTSNTMPLNEIALVRQREPDIHGFGKFHADGSVRISHDAQHELQFDLLGLNADASANSLELGGRNLGDARFTARTDGDVLSARVESNAAQAAINGEGTVRLSGDYPVDGRMTFSNAGLSAMAALALKAEDAKKLNVDGTAQGEMTLRGPMKTPEKLTATFDVNSLELHALNLPSFSVTNNGPLKAVLTRHTVRVESARLRAPQTDVTIGGTMSLDGQMPLDLQMRGAVNLAIARSFSPDLASTGTVTLDAAMKGTLTAPDLTGRASIRNGDFHYADFTNGLTNANGDVVFSGSRATIQKFTAESGGGKVDASGFAALSGGVLAFNIVTNASGVRVRYPEGVSSVSDARLTLAGTSQRSQASGTVTIHRVAINPKSDAAAILATTAQPVRTPAVRTGLIENLNLDIQIETAPDVTLETSVTQSIQADANLRLRGTVTNPAMLGRINITQGDLIFFGNKYSISQGAISFYNPVKIDPILNVDLETKARGVDVILTVSGPVDKLNVSYRSDPPLQFSDIVALLATGRAPSDPTQAVRDTGQSQSFQQLGASALLGQAIANPVAGRLQRFFGVSRLKIDPQLTGITGSPQARLTIEQQVTPDILFTYVTDVSSTNTQLIRVEWDYNRHWAAILTREENGYVGLDFAYKKRFR